MAKKIQVYKRTKYEGLISLALGHYLEDLNPLGGGRGHTLPVHGRPYCGGIEIVPVKVGAGLRPIGEITGHH
jgi:hypothetical protein